MVVRLEEGVLDVEMKLKGFVVVQEVMKKLLWGGGAGRAGYALRVGRGRVQLIDCFRAHQHRKAISAKKRC